MAAITAPAPTVVTQPALGEPERLSLVKTHTSPSSAIALSRFEFEADKGNEGTKILMVEWDSAAATNTESPEKQDMSDWEVSW